MKKQLSARQLYERTLTEADVVSAIRGFLELRGARVFRIVERIPWGRTTSEAGIPDLAGFFPIGCHALKSSILGPVNSQVALSWWIEVKRPGGKLRPAQAAWLEDAKRDGLIAFKAESVDEVILEFRKYGIDL